ncbi:hypothetical protein [Vandammella animalimorsus]|uniref:hypothetical protein n=1 Tax=Vandammella animalimorsus TaxID=2029117 RepID=UPI0015547D46|nr:hypothetical protein [Vandammella animalimorsus]
MIEEDVIAIIILKNRPGQIVAAQELMGLVGHGRIKNQESCKAAMIGMKKIFERMMQAV